LEDAPSTRSPHCRHDHSCHQRLASQALSNAITPGDISVIKTLSAALSLAVALSLLAPILVTSQPAQAGCERVYTSSGWQTRCN